MILAGAVILAAVGTYTMLQNEQQQPEKIQSMNQTPEEEKSVTEKLNPLLKVRKLRPRMRQAQRWEKPSKPQAG